MLFYLYKTLSTTNGTLEFSMFLIYALKHAINSAKKTKYQKEMK